MPGVRRPLRCRTLRCRTLRRAADGSLPVVPARRSRLCGWRGPGPRGWPGRRGRPPGRGRPGGLGWPRRPGGLSWPGGLGRRRWRHRSGHDRRCRRWVWPRP